MKVGMATGYDLHIGRHLAIEGSLGAWPMWAWHSVGGVCRAGLFVG